jgi:hypothetical protein
MAVILFFCRVDSPSIDPGLDGGRLLGVFLENAP